MKLKYREQRFKASLLWHTAAPGNKWLGNTWKGQILYGSCLQCELYFAAFTDLHMATIYCKCDGYIKPRGKVAYHTNSKALKDIEDKDTLFWRHVASPHNAEEAKVHKTNISMQNKIWIQHTPLWVIIAQGKNTLNDGILKPGRAPALAIWTRAISR